VLFVPSLIAHAKNGIVLSGVWNGGNKQALEGIAHPTKPSLDGEGSLRSSAPDVVVFRVTVTASVQGQRQQAHRIDNVALSAIVLADKDCQFGSQTDLRVRTRPKALES
jgi:hypothetical protein